MDNTVLDKQSVLSLIDLEMQKIVGEHNASLDDEEKEIFMTAYITLRKIKNEINSGQFNIPNPLQQQVEDMKQALEHYADRHNHPPFWLHDDGERARQALKSLTPTTEPSGAERLRDRYEMQECFANVNSKWYRKGILDAVNDLGIIIPGINAPKGEETEIRAITKDDFEPLDEEQSALRDKIIESMRKRGREAKGEETV